MRFVRFVIGIPFFLVAWAIGMYFVLVEICAVLTPFGVRWVDWLVQPMPSWWVDLLIPAAEWGILKTILWLAITSIGIGATAVILCIPSILVMSAVGLLDEFNKPGPGR